MLMEQWFVKTKPLADPAVAAVESGRTRFVPELWTKTYMHWMTNIKDWCISRQLWWGHRIPAWYCDACAHITVSRTDATACSACGGATLRQDEDVLDTWFSSALWPFATLGWPDETPDLEKFYPTQVLVTARDIINLWVARMIMTGLEFRGEAPFADVVIHATLMDDRGERMSKSKGTGVDPLEMIEAYGADALRFALAWVTTGTQDVKFGKAFSKQRVEMSRNFVTKLWNAARYAASKIGDLPAEGPAKAGAPAKPPTSGASDEDRWILSRLSTTIEAVTDALDRFEFGEAAQRLYEFVWDDFCDWYIELSKRRAEEPAVRQTLACVLDRTLRLMHPFTPFVTEELWQRLGRPQPLMTAAWPDPSERDAGLERRMALVFEAVRAVRDVRTRNNIPPKTALAVVVSTKEEATASLLKAGAEIIRDQANVDELTIGVNLPKPKLAATAALTGFTVHIPLGGKIDVKAEIARAKKDLERAREQAAQMERQLANEEFRKHKPEMAAELDAKLQALRLKRAELEAHLKDLEESP
jgi:valyl-tRNA synthetase